MKTKDEHVWMVLGNDDEKGACVAVVIAATAERAQELYQRQYPGHVPLAWPSLFDLKQSVRTLEHARDGVTDDTCPVIRDDSGMERDPGLPDTTLEDCPIPVLRVLDKIGKLMEQRGLDVPFENNASSFACAAFEAHAYQWEPEEAPGFFRWRDVTVYWYKKLYSGPRISRVPAKEELATMYEECRAAIMLHEQTEEGTE